MRKAWKPAACKGLDIGGGVDAAFGDADGVGRKLLDEFQRGFEADLEGFEVAVVDAIGVAANVPHRARLLPRCGLRRGRRVLTCGR